MKTGFSNDSKANNGKADKLVDALADSSVFVDGVLLNCFVDTQDLAASSQLNSVLENKVAGLSLLVFRLV